MTRIYVAGGSTELDRVEAFIASARAAGHAVTFDWTIPVREHLDAGVPDSALTDAQAEGYARAGYQGIREADLFVLLVPERSTGAWVELGIAIGRRMPIIVAGPRCRASIFTRLAHRVVATDAAALLLVGRAICLGGAWLFGEPLPEEAAP